MNIRQRALLDTARVIVLGLLVGVVGTLAADYFGLATVGMIAAILLLIYFAKTAYDIRVTQLEIERDRIERALKEGR